MINLCINYIHIIEIKHLLTMYFIMYFIFKDNLATARGLLPLLEIFHLTAYQMVLGVRMI